MKKMISNKKARYGALVLGGIALMALGIIAFQHGPTKADAADWTVPQFGANIGDYSSCFNGYIEDTDLPGNSLSGNWTPMGGGIQNGVSGIDSFQAGGCIEAGMATDTNNEYTQDFRIGIRVSTYGHNVATRSSSGSSVGADCDNWSAWQYTPWASTGGGDSAFAASLATASWGVECVQLRVDTQPLPPGVATITNPTFGITISDAGNPSGDTNAIMESQTTQACYLDRPWPGVNPNPPTPSCQMSLQIASANFYSASVSLGASSMGAIETANNIPTTFNPSETKATGTDGNPLSITFENTGGIPWASTFTEKDINGTQSGTCGYDYNGDGVKDAPASGSPANSSCSVSSVITSSNYALVHTASSFAVSPETIPISYKVTKTTTYTQPSTFTVTSNCQQNGPLPSDQACPLSGGSACQNGTCFATHSMPQAWTVSYSGGGYSGSIGNGKTIAFPMSSITAPSTPGTYSQTWQMEYNGTPFGAAFLKTLTVGSSTSSVGTITVTSENSQTNTVGNIPVNMKWDVLDAASDLCDHGAVCSGSSQTYLNQPVGIIKMPSSSIALLDPSSPYVFNSVHLAPVAQKKIGAIDAILALAKNVFGSTAEAFTTPLANPLAQTLGSGKTVAFVVLWDPEANIAVNSSTAASISLTATAGNPASGQVQVSNDGAPGSKLTWSASSDSSWLSVSPSADSSGLTNGRSGNTPESVTVNTSSTLPAGNYTGVITFNGISAPNNSWKLPLTASLSVTLVVTGNSQTPQYSCTDNACSEVSSGGVSSSSCIAACGEKQYGCVNNACAIVSSGGTTLPACQASCGGGSQPGYACENNACTPVSSGGVSQSSCQAACGGGGGGGSSNYSCVNNACVSVASGGTSLPNCEAACNGGHGGGTEYSCVNNACAAVSSGGTSLPDCKAACGTPQLPACTPGVNCPVCSPTLTATPSTIVVPESSGLSYSCSHVNECQISAPTGQFSTPRNVPTSGNVTTTPSITTTYTLTCTNSTYAPGPNNSAGGSATVTVSGSSYCEQNPNGVGCQ